jgi:hypothetical protein
MTDPTPPATCTKCGCFMVEHSPDGACPITHGAIAEPRPAPPERRPLDSYTEEELAALYVPFAEEDRALANMGSSATAEAIALPAEPARMSEEEFAEHQENLTCEDRSLALWSAAKITAEARRARQNEEELLEALEMANDTTDELNGIIAANAPEESKGGHDE